MTGRCTCRLPRRAMKLRLTRRARAFLAALNIRYLVPGPQRLARQPLTTFGAFLSILAAMYLRSKQFHPGFWLSFDCRRTVSARVL